MANVKISNLPSATTPLTGTEVVPIVQSSVTKQVTVSNMVLLPVSTVASLPSAATAGTGARRFVTDASATTFASTVAGGGANKVPVYSDGTNWKIG